MKFIENDRGFTYTLEAMIGIFLIIGMVLFFTNNMPFMAQKTGEHSKVQLMNMGRDALDLLEVTPVTDIFSDPWGGQVYRNYTLVADKDFATPGENVTFTVYKLGMDGPEGILYQNLTLEQSTLGLGSKTDIGIINGSMITTFFSEGEFSIRAVEYNGNDEVSWSNYVTIKIGYYYLDTDVRGISEYSVDKNISGVVYNPDGSGKPGLDIEILDYNNDPETDYSPITNTKIGRLIEDFESTDNWTSLPNNMTLNTTNKSGIYSISLNGNSSFWLQKINNTVYNFNYYDIISFYFFSINSNETIDVELSNSSTGNKFIWNNISSKNIGWNRINIKIKYPDKVEGVIVAEEVDTIKIMVTNITENADYLFDNLIAGEGRFTFEWPISGGGSTGSYYLIANNTINGFTSNKHRIIFSKFDKMIVADEYIIYEGGSTNIQLLSDKPQDDLKDSTPFNINQQFYHFYETDKLYIYGPIDEFNRIVTLTINTSGDYYIFIGNTKQCPPNAECKPIQGDPANAAKTNTILIRVLPIDRPCNVGECFICGGINLDELNEYMRKYLPPYVNFNLYLINPDGTLCYDCPEFKEIINGYPTSEAVTVNKVLHVNQQRNLGFMREIRMVLWYK